MANTTTLRKILARFIWIIAGVFVCLGAVVVGALLTVVVFANVLGWTGLGLSEDTTYLVATGMMLAILGIVVSTFLLIAQSAVYGQSNEILERFRQWDDEAEEEQSAEEAITAAEFNKVFGDRVVWDELPDDAKEILVYHWPNISLESVPPKAPANSNRKKRSGSKANRY